MYLGSLNDGFLNLPGSAGVCLYGPVVRTRFAIAGTAEFATVGTMTYNPVGLVEDIVPGTIKNSEENLSVTNAVIALVDNAGMVLWVYVA